MGDMDPGGDTDGRGITLMVTGHREIAHETLVLERCRQVLAKLRPALAISGGAKGADALFAQAAVEAGIPLALYLPNRHYRAHYPGAVDDRLVEAAQTVRYVVDRPDEADWRQRWQTEQWWRDNFERNRAMVRDSDNAVVISPRRPSALWHERKGGTAACVRDLAKARPDTKVIWLPDDDAIDVRWVRIRPTQQHP